MVCHIRIQLGKILRKGWTGTIALWSGAVWRAQEGSFRQPGRQLSATPITIPKANENGQALCRELGPAEHQQGKQGIRGRSDLMVRSCQGHLSPGSPSPGLLASKAWRGIAEETFHFSIILAKIFFFRCMHTYWLYPDLWIQQGPQQHICFWHQFLLLCRMVEGFCFFFFNSLGASG